MKSNNGADDGEKPQDVIIRYTLHHVHTILHALQYLMVLTVSTHHGIKSVFTSFVVSRIQEINKHISINRKKPLNLTSQCQKYAAIVKCPNVSSGKLGSSCCRGYSVYNAISFHKILLNEPDQKFFFIQYLLLENLYFIEGQHNWKPFDM